MNILEKALEEAKKGKTNYRQVKEMRGYEKYYLKELQDRLINKTYKTSEYTIETINDSGKERVIYKLPFFPDRIAQWAILLVTEPLLKNKLITDTYGAVPDRGIHFGFKRIQEFLKDKEGTKYCLKLDIKKYFPSINHKILKKIYRNIYKDKDLLWLLEEIIDSTNQDTGIPIGNYISQWDGIMYLWKFGHWLKEQLRLKYVSIYMDDIVILHKSKKFLHNILRKIQDYLKKNLKLRVKGNWQVFPTRVRGIDFLGYRFFSDYTLLRKSTAKEFKRKMRKINKKDKINEHDYCSINSYLGWLKWADTYNLKQKFIKPLEPKIKEYERRMGICK